MPGRSLKILIGLVAAAITFSGWLIAWQWKREVTQLRSQVEGTAFTREEQILIDLQDQLSSVRSENVQLGEEIKRLTEELEAATAKTGEE